MTEEASVTLKEIEVYKEKGNNEFKAGNLENSIKLFDEGIKLLERFYYS